MASTSEEKATSRHEACSDSEQQEASPAARSFFYNPLVHILLIACLGLVVYSNTFHSPFQWDEDTFITGNPIVHSLGYFADPSKAAGSRFYSALKSRYIGYLTFALNYHFGKYNVTGYHIVNLGIHLTNAVLVYLLIMLTLKTPCFNDQQKADKQEAASASFASNLEPRTSDLPAGRPASLIALFVALFFVAHPVQTEAVTYVFQRLASLVTMFYLLSVVSYAGGRLSGTRAGKLAGLFLSLLFAVLAMKTKENAFTLPVVIALYEFYFFEGTLKTRVLRLLPFLIALPVIPLAFVGADKPVGEVIGRMENPASLGYHGIPVGVYLPTQFRVIVTYIRLLFFPVNQNLDYTYPAYHSLWQLPVLLSFLLLLSLLGLAGYLFYRSRGHSAKGIVQQTAGAGKRQAAGSVVSGRQPPTSNLRPLSPYYRLISFGILWFFITLSVESSIIPIPKLIDEYRVYLPSVGAFAAIIAAVFAMTGVGGRPFSLRGAGRLSAILVLPVLLFSGATYARNNVWRSKVSLWTDVVRKGPDGTRGYCNLGLAYEKKGEYGKAIASLSRAILLDPASERAYVGRGLAFELSGQLDKALSDLDRAIVLSPSDANAYCNRGIVFREKGQLDRAIADYTRAIALDPYLGAAYYDRSMVFEQQGRLDKALEDLNEVIRLGGSRQAAAYYNRATILEKKGEPGKAREDYVRAITLIPNYEEAHVRLGVLYGKAGSFDKAIEHFDRAVAIKPKDSVAYNDRGFAYFLMKDYDRALENYTKAIELDRNSAAAYFNRGNLYLRKGDDKLAAPDFRKACGLKDGRGCEALRSLGVPEK